MLEIQLGQRKRAGEAAHSGTDDAYVEVHISDRHQDSEALNAGQRKKIKTLKSMDHEKSLSDLLVAGPMRDERLPSSARALQG